MMAYEKSNMDTRSVSMERYRSLSTSTGTRTRLTGGLFTRFRTGQDELNVWWLRIGFPAKKDCGPEEIRTHGGTYWNIDFHITAACHASP